MIQHTANCTAAEVNHELLRDVSTLNFSQLEEVLLGLSHYWGNIFAPDSVLRHGHAQEPEVCDCGEWSMDSLGWLAKIHIHFFCLFDDKTQVVVLTQWDTFRCVFPISHIQSLSHYNIDHVLNKIYCDLLAGSVIAQGSTYITHSSFFCFLCEHPQPPAHLIYY